MRTIVTVTPAPKAECPVVNQEFSADTDVNVTHLEDLPVVNQRVLDFLNGGGSPKLIIDRVKTQYAGFGNTDLDKRALEEDITGDGVPELLIAPDLYITIFGCQNGRYRVLFSQTTESVQEIDIRSVTDANKNGIPEVYTYISECLGSRCNRIAAFEWFDNDFKYVISDSVFSSKQPEYYCDDINEPFDLGLRDVDRDGIDELILIGQPPLWPDDIFFPYRGETRICKWNGQGFVFFRKEFSKPKYRFQALQDADIAAIQGEYNKALDLYNQTISNKKLEWWSIRRRFNDFWVLNANYFNDPTPTPGPGLTPDPSEYPSLAAYAYYRIMLLHLVQGNDQEATTSYGTLREKFGTDQYGHPYVEMATAFWDTYQSTHKMYDGCAASIQYAAEHPGILIPLGSDYHSTQSHTYIPADMCPFR